MAFFENTRKPVGFGGRIMVVMMNSGHGAMADWGFQFVHISLNLAVLDCGCGGGANIKKLLEKCPQGTVKAILEQVGFDHIRIEKTTKVGSV